MPNTEKYHGSESVASSRVYAGGATAIIGGIFLERSIFYGSRSIMFLYLFEGIGADLGGIYSMSFPLIMLASLLLALGADFLLDLRSMVMLGAILNGLGLIILSAGTTPSVLLGLALVAVGSSASKIGNFTYLGHLMSRSGYKIEGGYSFAWLAINLGAGLGAFALTFFVRSHGYPTAFLSLGILSIVNGLLMVLWRSMKILPSVSDVSGEPPKPMILQVVGLMGMCLLCTGFWFWMQLTYMAPNRYMLGTVVQLSTVVMLVIGMIVFATSGGQDVARRNGAMVLMILMAMFLWGAVDVGWSLMVLWDLSSSSQVASDLEAIVMVFLCLAMGLVLVLVKWRNAKGYQSAGLRLMIGVVVCAVANQLLLLVPALSEMAIFISMAIFAVGETIWNSLSMATAWRLAPQGRKGIAVGLMTGAMGLSSWMADLFATASDEGVEGANSTIPMLGLLLLSALAIFCALGVWQLLSNHRGDDAAPSANPFA